MIYQVKNRGNKRNRGHALGKQKGQKPEKIHRKAYGPQEITKKKKKWRNGARRRRGLIKKKHTKTKKTTEKYPKTKQKKETELGEAC